MAKLAINLVSWNGEKYIPFLIKSLKEQSYKDCKLYILDNGSIDNTVPLLKKEIENIGIEYELFQNQENIGFAGGHNKLFKSSAESYVLLLNQDIYLAPDCIEKLMSFVEQNSKVGGITPRLMRWDFEQKNFTNEVDSLGLKIFRSRRVVEWGTGERWVENKVSTTEVFGVSGALPLFRRSFLQPLVDTEGNIFDPLFGSYKEDVDLAFRLRVQGVESWLVPDAVAYHDRSAAGAKSLDDWSALRNKQTQKESIRYYSYRNHLYTLYKNEYWQNFLLDFPFIFWYELKKFVYFLLFDRVVLGGFKDLLKYRKKLKESRINNKQLRTITWKQIRIWWT